jgi:DNA-binding PadR family transcriptional regulator
MSPTGKRVLEVFDEMGQAELDLHTLLEMAGGNLPADREAVLDAVTGLVSEGWLRATGKSDYYARTEEGRRQLARIRH